MQREERELLSEDLRRALVAKPDQFVQAFTENLLTYALGRTVDYHDMPAVRSIDRKTPARVWPSRWLATTAAVSS